MNQSILPIVAQIDWHDYVERNSSALTILALTFLVLMTLLILVPQLLRSHQRTVEMQHQERMRTLENGQVPVTIDTRSNSAGRIAMLVPMVVICAAGTVTCFLVAYRTDNLFAVSVGIWSVAGVVSLAAITGGVALLGRLAQLTSGIPDEEPVEEPVEK